MTLETRLLWWKIFRWWVRIGPSHKEHRQLIEALSERLFISDVDYRSECRKRGYPYKRWAVDLDQGY